MANLNIILKFGYVLVIVSIFLMIWVSRIETLEIDRGSASHQDHPPCFFNPECTCSKALQSDLGIVQCKNVALPNMPKALNMSKVFMLHLSNNDLKWFEPYFLHGTGLYRLEISHNPLGDISVGAFTGLERYLWELRLTYNQLIEVPTKSLRFLQKLRLLDLTGNDISTLEPENWRGLESSLQILIIADNSISKLSVDTFSGLPLLEIIDLRGNNIKSIDPNVFRDGLAHLTKILLGDNQLTEIPYLAVSPLRILRYLDLSKNLIAMMVPNQDESIEVNDQGQTTSSTLLSLDTLRLDYNQITVLHPGSFQYFSVLNNTYLDGNPISMLQSSAFRNAKIRDLFLRNCRLTNVNPEAFDGLEGSLQTLDLSGNNITNVMMGTTTGALGLSSNDANSNNNDLDMLFTRFQSLHTLSLKNNLIQKINPVELFNGFQYSLLHLDLSGKDNPKISLQELRRLRNLRSLKLSRLMQSHIGPEDFMEFGINLDELTITDSNLKTIKNHAFMHIRGLKLLDLSENNIDNFESDCFTEIGHSLISLNLGHSLSNNVKEVPAKVFKSLNNLQYLNIANNYFNQMSDTSFYFLKNIKEIHLEDNKIHEIHKGTFQGDIHNDLEEIYLSFNNIELIEQHTFVDLVSLQHLYIDDNKITKINRRAFMNLDRLKYLTLRGNKLTQINDESFQNLPELEHLDLAYNSLQSFNFDCFDQVGQLSSAFKVNISHNLINQLRTNFTVFANAFSAGQHDINYNQYYLGPVIHSNIKILDISYNNISYISRGYFRPVEISLSHLYLSNNQIQNVTRDVFNNIPHLQSLDLSSNAIRNVDYDAFKNTKKIQIFTISNNQLENIHVDTFHKLKDLRVMDLSKNKFRSLPDQLIQSDNIEILNLSNNQFNKISILSILSTQAAYNLCELDLSGNFLTSLAYSDIFNKFKSLLWLDLSNNHLIRIDDGTFSQLSRLIYLDLSNNQNLDILDGGYSFRGLEHTILELKLNNVSLTSVPDLPFYHLRLLSISNNELPTVSTDISINITKTLRHLDLSSNDLTAIPLIIHSLTILRYLSLANNPITTITNATFNSAQMNNTLKELDLRKLALSTFENGALSNFDSLRTLHLSVQNKLLNFNIPKVLMNVNALKNLHIQIDDETNLANEMLGILPNKLQNITFTGSNLKYLDESILKGVQNSVLNIAIKNTNIMNINIKLFKHLKYVRNITIWIENNGTITHIDNPSTGDKPNLPRNTFLTSLHISGKGFKCDCQLGWIEVWERKKRQYLCGNNNIFPTTFTKEYKDNIDCRLVSDELRNIICINDKNNNSIIDVFKSDIECGWGSYGHTNQDHTAFTAPILIAFITLLRIF